MAIKKKKRKGSSYKKEAIYFFIKFFMIMAVLFFLELFNPVHQKVIIPFTGLMAKASAFLLRFFGTKAEASGTLITSHQFIADIKAGCTGIEPVIILLAAIFAFPSPWRTKCYGALFGIVILQLVNLIRIVSLVYLGINHPKYFSDAHTYIWQIIIIALSLFLWMVWARGLKRNEAKAV